METRIMGNNGDKKMIQWILNLFEPNPAPQPDKTPIPANTHGLIDSTGIDSCPGYKDVGRFNPVILSAAVKDFLTTHPTCTDATISTFSRYMIIHPTSRPKVSMAVSGLVYVDDEPEPEISDCQDVQEPRCWSSWGKK